MNGRIEDLAEAILRQAPDAIVFADVAGSIAMWNDRAESMFGFPRDEVLGQSLDIIIPEHLRKAHWLGFEAAVTSGQTKTGGNPIVTRAVSKGGGKLYVEMSFSLVTDAAGRVVGALAIARDVTAKHLARKAGTAS